MCDRRDRAFGDVFDERADFFLVQVDVDLTAASGCPAIPGSRDRSAPGRDVETTTELDVPVRLRVPQIAENERFSHVGIHAPGIEELVLDGFSLIGIRHATRESHKLVRRNTERSVDPAGVESRFRNRAARARADPDRTIGSGHRAGVVAGSAVIEVVHEIRLTASVDLIVAIVEAIEALANHALAALACRRRGCEIARLAFVRGTSEVGIIDVDAVAVAVLLTDIASTAGTASRDR